MSITNYISQDGKVTKNPINGWYHVDGFQVFSILFKNGKTIAGFKKKRPSVLKPEEWHPPVKDGDHTIHMKRLPAMDNIGTQKPLKFAGLFYLKND